MDGTVLGLKEHRDAFTLNDFDVTVEAVRQRTRMAALESILPCGQIGHDIDQYSVIH